MRGEDQTDYDGLSPQEQIDVFERVSLRTAVAMIKQIESLKAEIAKLREDKARTIRKAWYAGSSWTLGGMKGFKQCYPELQEYLKRELGE